MMTLNPPSQFTTTFLGYPTRSFAGQGQVKWLLISEVARILGCRPALLYSAATRARRSHAGSFALGPGGERLVNEAGAFLLCFAIGEKSVADPQKRMRLVQIRRWCIRAVGAILEGQPQPEMNFFGFEGRGR